MLKRSVIFASMFNFTEGTASFQITTSSQPVPEPSTLAIFALGIMGLASRRFVKK